MLELNIVQKVDRSATYRSNLDGNFTLKLIDGACKHAFTLLLCLLRHTSLRSDPKLWRCSGACPPIASGAKCAGGSGNAPAYVTGPVRVVGPDVYNLDPDRDGVACK